jgi:hypothetical protein
VSQWSKALHCSGSCATRDPGSTPGSVTADCNRETHGGVDNCPSVVWVRGEFGWQGCSCPSRTSDSCGRPGTLTWLPGVRCYLRHIGAAGFWVKRAVCQEAVRLGLAWLDWVVLCFGGRTALNLHLSQVCMGVASNGTRLYLPIGYHKKGV